MLTLLSFPRWHPESLPALDLPVTLPAALLIVLARQSRWMDRDGLAALFWPDASSDEALHRLRISLHRSRELLRSWGRADALVAERRRLRLDLDCDLRRFDEAAARRDAAGLARVAPGRWLEGWQLAGFETFADWCADEGRRLAATWQAAAPHALARTLREGDLASAQALVECWQQEQGVLAALRSATARVDPDADAHAIWSQLHDSSEVEDAMAPVRRSPGRPTVLAGRQEVQARLLASSTPALVLLGEPGVGKSTLLDASWPQAPRLQGREGLQAVPYRPLLEALRAALPEVRRALADPASDLAPYRLDLARVMPELAPDEPLPPLDAVTAKARLAEALARVAEALAPCWRVDDLQWCDGATLEWLVNVAHRGRLRWRAVGRIHELDEDARRALDALRRDGLLDEQVLAPMTRPGLAQMCAARWPGRTFEPAQIERLHVASHGNAFVACELIEAGWDLSGEVAPPGRALELVQRRLARLPAADRALVEAAAVLGEPVAAAALRTLAEATDDDANWARRCDRLIGSGLLRVEGALLACAHDLVRHAAYDTIGPVRRAQLHRRAALWLAEQPEPDGLVIAGHWQSANEKQIALAWLHRGALHQKALGRFDAAMALWQRVATESHDVALALRAQLERAACGFFDDLAASRAALDTVAAQLGAVADPAQHDALQARVLAGLVDNWVFSGDLPAARRAADRLLPLLPRVPSAERVEGLEVLIELAMREPDIEAAWRFLGELRRLAPQRPSILSFEGQIHWFGGNVRAACDSLHQLLARHPDHRRGLTIENDLAVMLQALGELGQAEVMARRSLESWAGVAHTQTLSLLVLGLVLTSQGRHAEADETLQRALALARQQSSPGFEAEAQVRRARLLLQCGRVDEARAALAIAAPLLRDSPEPLRVSQWALMEVLAASSAGEAPTVDVLDRLAEVAARSTHPLVQVRRARVAFELSWPTDPSAAATAADEQAHIARQAGLLEALAEALLLRARAAGRTGAPAVACRVWVEEAAAIAQARGFADLAWRSQTWLAAHAVRGAAVRARAALRQLRGAVRPSLFDEAAAARREPRPGPAADTRLAV